MSRANINILVEILEPFLIWDRDLLFKKECICANYLTTHLRMYDLMFKYDMAQGGISGSIRNVTDLIVEHVIPEYVQWPECVLDC